MEHPLFGSRMDRTSSNICRDRVPNRQYVGKRVRHRTGGLSSNKMRPRSFRVSQIFQALDIFGQERARRFRISLSPTTSIGGRAANWRERLDFARIDGPQRAGLISAGEWITATGEWVNDRTHGQQFKARRQPNLRRGNQLHHAQCPRKGMAALGESCRRSGHGSSSVRDPKRAIDSVKSAFSNSTLLRGPPARAIGSNPSEMAKPVRGWRDFKSSSNRDCARGSSGCVCRSPCGSRSRLRARQALFTDAGNPSICLHVMDRDLPGELVHENRSVIVVIALLHGAIAE
jgi:hypothetical protein